MFLPLHCKGDYWWLTCGARKSVGVSLWHFFDFGVIVIKLLEDRILKDGEILPGNVLKVGSFLNQQIDTVLLKEIGEEIARLFKDCGVNKILTIEASGIAIAVSAAFAMGVPVVFAKKNRSTNISGEVLVTEVESFTHGVTNKIVVAKEFITEDDVILVVDDFLANGKALAGLFELVKSAGATYVGAAVAVEKGFQKGGDSLREKGVRVESLAIIDEMTEDSIVFRQQNN